MNLRLRVYGGLVGASTHAPLSRIKNGLSRIKHGLSLNTGILRFLAGSVFFLRLVCYSRTTSASTTLAHQEGCAALRIVLVTVPRVSLLVCAMFARHLRMKRVVSKRETRC